MSNWFPCPTQHTDVVLLEPSGTWTAAEVFRLLTDPAAAQWRHKVGVAGARDGSARPTTRLMAIEGWVIKTRVDQPFASFELAHAGLLQARRVGKDAGLWHPDKLWAVMLVDGLYYQVTVCPELATLRQIEGLKERMSAWIDMFQAGIEVHRLHGVGLDVNPSNFGRVSGTGLLYYLDEDVYPALDERNLAGAIVARIAEEPTASVAEWREWGNAIRQTLTLGPFTWDGLQEEIRQYPVPERFESARSALLSVLSLPGLNRRVARQSDVTCVIADVHSNLPALDAVLADAKSRGATRYLFLGDAVGYGPFPSECVQRLAELPQLTSIRGNHDHAIGNGLFEFGMNSLARQCAQWTHEALSQAELAWLRELPLDHTSEGWMAVHGAPKDPHRFLAYVYDLTYEDNLRQLREQKTSICFYGHTHIQLTHVELAGGPSKLPGPRSFDLTPKNYWLVNPGSVGQPRDGDPRAAYGLWRPESGQFSALRVSYDLDSTLRAIRAAGLPSKLEDRMRVGA